MTVLPLEIVKTMPFILHSETPATYRDSIGLDSFNL